jgi:O-acetyl-ADP-ribose deacetylase (regulator of RNase III)
MRGGGEMNDRVVWGGARITLVSGDVSKQDTEAIVNAANSNLVPGAGVDGAIRRAAGPALTEATAAIAARSAGVPLPTGSAVATTAGNLKASRVIHTAGPIWRGGARGEAGLLARCYRSCLQVASEEGLRSISLPALSAGIYGYPLREAAEIAVATVREELEAHEGSFDEVRFVLYGDEALAQYQETLCRSVAPAG